MPPESPGWQGLCGPSWLLLGVESMRQVLLEGPYGAIAGVGGRAREDQPVRGGRPRWLLIARTASVR
jgi:hypothetical protein